MVLGQTQLRERFIGKVQPFVVRQLPKPERFQQSLLGGRQAVPFQERVAEFVPRLSFCRNVELGAGNLDRFAGPRSRAVPVLSPHLDQSRLYQELWAKLRAGSGRELQTLFRRLGSRFYLPHLEIQGRQVETNRG